MNTRALTDEQEREAAERYRRGETLAQLAAAYGCSNGPIRVALQKHRVKRRRYVSACFGRGRYV